MTKGVGAKKKTWLHPPKDDPFSIQVASTYPDGKRRTLSSRGTCRRDRQSSPAVGPSQHPQLDGDTFCRRMLELRLGVAGGDAPSAQGIREQ